MGEPSGTYRPYDLGQQMDVWVKRADGSNAQGKVWPPDTVVFPDYSRPAARYKNRIRVILCIIRILLQCNPVLENGGLRLLKNSTIFLSTMGCGLT